MDTGNGIGQRETTQWVVHVVVSASIVANGGLSSPVESTTHVREHSIGLGTISDDHSLVSVVLF